MPRDDRRHSLLLAGLLVLAIGFLAVALWLGMRTCSDVESISIANWKEAGC